MFDDDPLPQGRRSSFLASARAIVVMIAAGLWAALGTLWTIYAWYHQEVVVPSTAPVNLTTEVSVKEVGTGGLVNGSSEDKLDAIELMVTANNVSTRNIRLLANYWDASGGRVAPQLAAADPVAWLNQINKLQTQQQQTGLLRYSEVGKYYSIPKFERVGWGSIFPESYILYPKETISASVVFFVPKATFDVVHVEVHIPTTEKLKGVDLRFLVDADRTKTKYFQTADDGQAREVVDAAAIDALKIQETQARRQLSLWHPQAAARGALPEQLPAPR